MPPNPLALPTPPGAIRVFRGYRHERLTRTQFFEELGTTFMPGTPLMQAPLGLAAYLPAVPDLPDPAKRYPDEVALIVYASRDIYEKKRSTSLSRRMYTHSHRAVFDMDRSPADFAGSASAPAVRDGAETWCLFDNPIDWQDGETRVVFVAPATPGHEFPGAFRETVTTAAALLPKASCDQVVVVAATYYAVMWLHAPSAPSIPVNDMKVLPDNVDVLCELVCTRAYVRGDDDRGVQITERSAFNWMFSRDLLYFKPRG